jgi:micrococcal nuclease
MVRSRAVVVATLAVTSVLGTSALGWWFGDQRRAADQPYRVVQVFDGDTIVVRAAGARDQTIRLLGVDTPETHHPRKPVQCYGPEAAAYTTSRLFGRVVTLEDDVVGHDVYGRRLAYVYVDGANFERELLQKGYARLLVIEPNHAHARDMLDDELNARAHRTGLWGVCGGS